MDEFWKFINLHTSEMFTFAGLLVSFYIARAIAKSNEAMRESARIVFETYKVSQENTKTVMAIQQEVAVVHKTTNSILEARIKEVGEAAYAKGERDATVAGEKIADTLAKGQQQGAVASLESGEIVKAKPNKRTAAVVKDKKES